MAVIEILGRDERTERQFRLGHLLTVALIVVGMLYGLNLREGALFATQQYNNVQAGISMNYPVAWLLDTDGDYVVRLRDMRRIGYKTTIQIALAPAGGSASNRNILDVLNISRPLRLNSYDVQAIEPYTMPDGTAATRMTYTFVDDEPNKFLQTVPVVVIGWDVLVRRGEQALIVTFRSDANTFESDLIIFERLLSSLEF